MKNQLTIKLPANDLGMATEFLGIKNIQVHDYIALTLKKKVQTIVNELGVTESGKVNIACDASSDLSTSDGNAAEPTFHYRRVVGMI